MWETELIESWWFFVSLLLQKQKNPLCRHFYVNPSITQNSC